MLNGLKVTTLLVHLAVWSPVRKRKLKTCLFGDVCNFLIMNVTKYCDIVLDTTGQFVPPIMASSFTRDTVLAVLCT